MTFISRRCGKLPSFYYHHCCYGSANVNCREWGYFVGFSEDWLKVLDEAEKDRIVDPYSPTYTRHWEIDPKYVVHLLSRNEYLFNLIFHCVDIFISTPIKRVNTMGSVRK